MAYERKDNSGAVFVNDRKAADNHPDRSGDAIIDGRAYWVNGWLKKDKNGKQYLSLAFKPKDTTRSAAGEYEAELSKASRQAQAIERGIKPPMGNAPATKRQFIKGDLDDEVPF